MDFFTAVTDANPANDDDDDNHNSFAQAIASRFGAASILTAKLTPTTAMNSTTTPTSSTATIPTTPFSSLPPNSLPSWLDLPTTLILDIRPHAAYSSARVPRAVSLSVPSTLLKRPLFSLERLAAMLHSANARIRFSTWRSASRILVYDADSTAIPDSSNIQGLLRKFRNDGFMGELAWLQGGFQAVWRECRDLVDTLPPTPEAETEEDEDEEHQPKNVLRTKHLPRSAFSLSSTTASGPSNKRVAATAPFHTAAPFSASNSTTEAMSRPAFNPFFDTIRQNIELSHGITERIPLRLPRRVRRRIHDLPFPWLQDIAKRAANAPPQLDRPVHSNHHNYSSSSSASSEAEDDDVDDATADATDVEEGTEALAMQFYRIELAEQRRMMGVMEHHSKESGKFADTFSVGAAFPFSITAGVEKGAKNRYRHIWPFEHARVRLHQKREADDDYVNASYVQPLGTTKRYIATQGPLPATFSDFWTLCWEQNVHVIVMLTREMEGSQVKCGTYWQDSAYGPLRLKLVSSTAVEGAGASDDVGGGTGFFTAASFNTPSGSTVPSSSIRPGPRHHDYQRHSHQHPLPHRSHSHNYGYHGHQYQKHPHNQSHRSPKQGTPPSTTIRRVFELSHTGYPAASPRRIVHLQYLEWPDMNVPDDPRGVLRLVQDVENAVRETRGAVGVVREDDRERTGTITKVERTELDAETGVAKRALGKDGPVLLHCSAGVGRTGGFIAVDAVLDAVRREMRKSEVRERVETEGWFGEKKEKDTDGMDVDEGGGEGNGISRPPVTTMPLVIAGGGAMGKEGDREEKKGEGLVVHVPVTDVDKGGRGSSAWLGTGVVGKMEGDGGRTPMQTEDNKTGVMEMMEVETSDTATDTTRKWAESVSDEAASNPAPAQPSSISAHPPSSVFPSGTSRSGSSSSEDSFGFSRGGSGIGGGFYSSRHRHQHHYQSSSLATSVSGTSSPGMKSAGISVSMSAQQHQRHHQSAPTTILKPSHDVGKTKSLPYNAAAAAAAPSAVVAEGIIHSQSDGLEYSRARTFSAPPGHHLMMLTARLQPQGGIGSSPLASSSTPWLSGERDRKFLSPQPVQQQQQATFSPTTSASVVLSKNTRKHGESGAASSDGEQPPSRSVSPSVDESAAGRAGGSRNPKKPVLSLSQLPSAFVPSVVDSISPPFSGPPTLATDASSGSSDSLPPPTHRLTNVDYKEPRPLHGHLSPLALSKYEEPIWEVVQDMREQRMSLCQSLRQYVFVHAAVIEGALMVVDEERERWRALGMVPGVDVSQSHHESKSRVKGEARTRDGWVRPAGLSRFGGSEGGIASVVAARATSPIPAGSTLLSLHRFNLSSPPPPRKSTADSSMASSTSTGKRGASPTELLKEGKTGEVMLSKRPSIKRKQPSGDGRRMEHGGRVSSPPPLQGPPG